MKYLKKRFSVFLVFSSHFSRISKKWCAVLDLVFHLKSHRCWTISFFNWLIDWLIDWSTYMFLVYFSVIGRQKRPRILPTNPEIMGDSRAPPTSYGLIESLKKNPKLVEEAAEVAKDAASSLGLLLKDPKIPDAFTPVPVTLLPSYVSQHAIHEVLQLQPDINLLMHRVSHDREFLTESLAGVRSVDPFIGNLLDIYKQIDIDSQWELDFIRSDYLLHCNDSALSFIDAVKVNQSTNPAFNQALINQSINRSTPSSIKSVNYCFLVFPGRNVQASGSEHDLYCIRRSIRANERRAQSHFKLSPIRPDCPRGKCWWCLAAVRRRSGIGAQRLQQTFTPSGETTANPADCRPSGGAEHDGSTDGGVWVGIVVYPTDIPTDWGAG